MTLSGKGSKCRVCTHPGRAQIESLLAGGASIAAARPIMGDVFSRRALYRHRAMHMIAAGAPAARPVPFPHDGTAVERIKWLQREAEHTAALAEQRGDLRAKLKAIHELSRLIWLEQRASLPPADENEKLYQKHLERMAQRIEEAQARREAALNAERDNSSRDD